MKTIVIRHRKENLKKCSLRYLQRDPNVEFLTYPLKHPRCFERCLRLRVDAPPLTYADRHSSLLLLDATWALADKMESTLQLSIPCRSLPKGFVTAYPRRQDVDGGLASIEALYIAYLILGEEKTDLLNHYHWKHSFLEKNHALLVELSHANSKS